MTFTGTVVCLFVVILAVSGVELEGIEDEHGVRIPTKCEVCKYLVTELQQRLSETSSSEVLRTGHGLDKKPLKEIKYDKSDLRLIEALTDPHVCDKILEYNVHKEKKGSMRYAKGMSETMQTLHGLVDKGVKVELGMPYELWDKPSAEVTAMQRKCYKMVEDYEEDIEDWYYNNREKDMIEYFCSNLVLKGNDDKTCLTEKEEPEEDKKGEDGDVKEEKKNKKKKKGKKKKKNKGKRKDETETQGLGKKESKKVKEDTKTEKQRDEL
ncbi:protein canopy 4 [Lingula anatina]|uniref:Protein canopy 4 n=1 Tax=Lingula anatina TaxID=7574 RepID=A0A1S3IT26_LINAN|nr:protein canopy 4 [Lingula anatina]|eukprot:XP_013401233.1 protein canopy 4 [Lingula anatina]